MDFVSSDVTVLSAGLLAARLVLGLLIAAHGAQKLFGWFGGKGLGPTVNYFESLSFRPARPLAVIASVAEITGGLLMALGLFGPIGPALILAVMIVAVAMHRKGGIFAANGGVELPLLYATGAVAIAVVGPGALSLDALLGIRWAWSSELALTALSVAALSGVFNLVARKSAVA